MSVRNAPYPRGNKDDPPDAAPDQIGARLLETAARIVESRGLRGLNIAELARDAEVSRPTIYRRYQSSDDVVRALLAHRAQTLVRQTGLDTTDRTSIVTGVLEFGDLFRTDPVFRRLLEHEPEIFGRYTLQRIGRSQRVILEWIAAALAAAQAGGTVRTGNAHDMALMVLIISQGALFSGPTVSDLIGAESWRTELAHVLDSYLRP